LGVQPGVGETVSHIAFSVLKEMRVHEERDGGIGVTKATLDFRDRRRNF
jgi:hypothetical protein